MSAPFRIHAILPAPPDLWYLDTEEKKHTRALSIVIYSGEASRDDTLETIDDLEQIAYDAAGYQIADMEVPDTCPSAQGGWFCPGHPEGLEAKS